MHSMWRSIRSKVSSTFYLTAEHLSRSLRLLSSDLLSRHVNKCHSGTPATVAARANKRNNHANTATTATSFPNVTASTTASVPCDQCLQLRQHCDFGAPCGKPHFRFARDPLLNRPAPKVDATRQSPRAVILSKSAVKSSPPLGEEVRSRTLDTSSHFHMARRSLVVRSNMVLKLSTLAVNRSSSANTGQITALVSNAPSTPHPMVPNLCPCQTANSLVVIHIRSSPDQTGSRVI